MSKTNQFHCLITDHVLLISDCMIPHCYWFPLATWWSHQCRAKQRDMWIAITFCLEVASQKWVLFDVCLTHMPRSFMSLSLLGQAHQKHLRLQEFKFEWHTYSVLELTDSLTALRNPTFHAIFSFAQILEDWHNNKKKNVDHYGLMRIFTYGLYFREEKAEELISWSVKNKYMSCD